MKKYFKLIFTFVTTLFLSLNCYFNPVKLNATEEVSTIAKKEAYTGSYYDSINPGSLTGGMNGTLRQALTSLIKPAGYYTYSGSGASNLSTILQYADEDPNNSNNMIYFYTQASVTKNAASSWNREHAWPQSQSGGLYGTSGAGADILHIRPTYNTTNSTRSNYPYGEANSSSVKTYNGYEYGWVGNGYFEPLDEVKGDCARITLYMWVCYFAERGTPITNNAQSVELMVKWANEDQPSQIEINRNNYCETSKQKNRNPFVDHPEWVDLIFGSGETTVDQTKVNNVISLISALPANIELAHEAQVNAANSAYAALNYKEKELVTNYSVLTAALNKITELKNAQSGGNTSGGNGGNTPVVGENKTFNFANQTGLATAYSANQTITVSGTKFLLTYGGYFSPEVRLGHNKATTLPSKYNVSGGSVDGSAMEMLSDVQNIQSISVKAGGSYGTISKWQILFSENGGSSFTLVSEGTNINSISAQLSSPKTGRFALVIIGTKPRLILSSLSYTVASASTSEPAKVDTAYINSYLDISYKLEGLQYSVTSTKLVFKAYLNENTYDANAKYYIRLKEGDTEAFNDVLVSYDSKTKSFTYSFEANPNTEWTASLVVVSNGQTNVSNETTMSVVRACQYYIDNNIITDPVQLLILKMIVTN